MWEIVFKDFHWYIASDHGNVVCCDKFMDYAQTICDKHNKTLENCNELKN